MLQSLAKCPSAHQIRYLIGNWDCSIDGHETVPLHNIFVKEQKIGELSLYGL